jgi:transposase InsO family protein
MLTDRGSCFTAEGFEKLCRELGVAHRKTRPDPPRTNGLAERCNGRIQREVHGITLAGHRDLERRLVGFSWAYNARRQRVLDGRSPEEAAGAPRCPGRCGGTAASGGCSALSHEGLPV